MPDYEFKLFGRTGKPQRTRNAECVNDDDAIQEAAGIEHQFRLEIWSQDRLVWDFEAVSGA